MKNFITIFVLMTAITTSAQNGKATTTKKTFNRTTVVSIDIQADEAIIWALLTNASGFPRWNSTVVSIDGEIQKGKKIKLKSTLDPKRTFKLKVKEMEPEKEMVWEDGKGKRTYTLEKLEVGKVKFTMHEKLGGLFFPMYKKFIPSFDKSFEQFASDLKKEAELIQKSK